MNYSGLHRCALVFAVLISHSVLVMADEPSPIKDNSFLIEEAYNQEPGVIQWIATVQHFRDPANFWAVGLTQEFPLHGIRHQLSWTVPVETDHSNTFRWGRVALHYRYQLFSGSNGIAIAPRVSILLPTDPVLSTDTEKIEWQANLPVSLEVTGKVIMHLNAGATYSPGHRSILRVEGAPQNEDLMAYVLGGSIVFLAHPNLNLMTEFVHSSAEEFGTDFAIEWSEETIVNPGVRVAINQPFGQFVPGFALPIRFADGETDIGVFGYLSFEHSL